MSTEDDKKHDESVKGRIRKPAKKSVKHFRDLDIYQNALATGLPARAADLPLKAPPPAPLLPSWTGFYVGGQIGGGWNDRTVNYAGNDPVAVLLVRLPSLAVNVKLSVP